MIIYKQIGTSEFFNFSFQYSACDSFLFLKRAMLMIDADSDEHISPS